MTEVLRLAGMPSRLGARNSSSAWTRRAGVRCRPVVAPQSAVPDVLPSRDSKKLTSEQRGVLDPRSRRR